MQWLEQAALDAIYDAAVDADLVDRDTRAVLLQGVADDIRLALPDHARPDVQFRSDLQQLNRPTAGGVPLRAWLAEAAELAEGRPAAAVFTEALSRPAPPPAEVEAPADAPSEAPAETDPPDPPDPRRIAIIAGAAVVGVGAIVALAVGGGGEPAPDGPPDAAVVDAAPDRPPLRLPLAVRVAEASRYRPALYRVGAGTVPLLDVDGPRVVGAAVDLAWSRTPVTVGRFRAVTGGVPPGAGPDDAALVGADLLEVRTYCDGLSRIEGRRPYYASGGEGDGYRVPDDGAWVYICSGGRFGPPAPGSWGLLGFGEAPELVAWGEGVARRTGGAAGIAACTAGREIEEAEDGGLPAFRVVRPLADGPRVPLPTLPEPTRPAPTLPTR